MVTPQCVSDRNTSSCRAFHVQSSQDLERPAACVKFSKIDQVSGTALQRKSISSCSIGRTILPSRPGSQGASRGGKVKAGRVAATASQARLGLDRASTAQAVVGRSSGTAQHFFLVL